MKVIKSLIGLLVVIIVVGLLLPEQYRLGYGNYAYGKVLEWTGDQGSASDAYKSAADAMPENIAFVTAYARTLNDIGEAKTDETFFETVKIYLDAWIDEHKTHDEIEEAYIELARAQWGLEDKAGAKRTIDEAVNLAPTNYIALVYQGIIYRDIRPTNKDSVRLSIPIFEQAIMVRNNTRVFWAEYELAKAWFMVGDDTRALNEVNQALSQFPPRWLREKAERLKHEIQSSGRSES